MAEQKTAARSRTVPEPTLVSAPFWNGANEGRLMLQFDRESGKPQFWPRPVNIRSGRRDFEWRAASGKGTLYAWTEVHVPARGFDDVAPYIVAGVELDEGARIMARLVRVTSDELSPGMKVRVAWERVSDAINMYVFEPDR